MEISEIDLVEMKHLFLKNKYLLKCRTDFTLWVNIFPQCVQLKLLSGKKKCFLLKKPSTWTLSLCFLRLPLVENDLSHSSHLSDKTFSSIMSSKISSMKKKFIVQDGSILKIIWWICTRVIWLCCYTTIVTSTRISAQLQLQKIFAKISKIRFTHSIFQMCSNIWVY